jgi:hypothetical protein
MWSEQKVFQSVCKVSELIQSHRTQEEQRALRISRFSSLWISVQQQKQENKNASLNALLCSHLS